MPNIVMIPTRNIFGDAFSEMSRKIAKTLLRTLINVRCRGKSFILFKKSPVNPAKGTAYSPVNSQSPYCTGDHYRHSAIRKFNNSMISGLRISHVDSYLAMPTNDWRASSHGWRAPPAKPEF
jgi:hypothetical protein